MIRPVSTGSEEAADANLAIGTMLAGRYRVEALLGTGGMGAVYRAEHVHMRKAVALKILHREMTSLPEVVARFEREAVAAARIEHPNVVCATDFGRLEDGVFYLVLEYVEGRSLSKVLSEEGALAPERALRIARQIADALAAAHAAGVVHRDLKPDNVMLINREGYGDFVKVLDFGIAKVKSEETADQPALTQLGTVFGTPEYMSPEQARGDHVDARSDLYTLGLILYEMLTGSSPFKDPDLVVVLTRHLTQEPPPLPAHVDPRIAELTLKLLKKDPVQRVQTAQEVVERADNILLGAPASNGWRVPASVAAASLASGRIATAPPSSAMPLSAKEQVAPTLLGGATPETAPSGKLRSISKSFIAFAQSLGPSVQIRGQRVSAGVLGAALGLLLTIGALTVFVLAQRFSNAEQKNLVVELSKPKDPDIAALVAKAESGDVKALAELSARPEGDRSAVEWRALGHGYVLVNQASAALAAYSAGVNKHVALAQDKIVLSDVRRAADEKENVDAALKIAAGQLGSDGLDLIYDVWDAAKGKPEKAAIAKRAKALLDDSALTAKASPALQILLELPKVQKSEGCAGIKRLLPQVTEQADERAASILQRFNDRRGCGFLGLGDCYGCLRASNDLSTALKTVQSRAAPDFQAKTGAVKNAADGPQR